MLAVLSSFLAYSLGPLRPAVSHSRSCLMGATMQEYKLNNYVLDGPLSPLSNQVLVKMSKAEEKTTGGLFVPAAATEKPREGLVVAVGPGRTHPDTGALLPVPVASGDIVLLSEFTGERVDYNGEKHMFITTDEILGVFDDGKVGAATFKPLRDNVLVEVAESATETASGIALATETDEEPNQGEVVAVGEGQTTSAGDVVPTGIEVGKKVLFAKYGGSDATLDGKKYKVVGASTCQASW
jgi:chaperonin GroES